MHYSVLQCLCFESRAARMNPVLQGVAMCGSELQSIVACGSVWQRVVYVAVRGTVL